MGDCSSDAAAGEPPEMLDSAMEDRLRGALLGLAAGDKIGGPLQMALNLAESLGELSRFDAGDYGRRLLEWHSLGSFDTGPVAEAVFMRAASGVPFQTASSIVHARFRTMTAGCNPAHRCAPLGMARCVQASELEAAAREQASMTHAHPLAGDAAAAVALLIRALISGDSWAAALAGLRPSLLPSHAQGESAVPPAALAHCAPADLDRVSRAAGMLLAQWARGAGDPAPQDDRVATLSLAGTGSLKH